VRKGLSIVIPIYNESGNIIPLVDDIYESFKKEDFQIILVSNGSSDNSESECQFCYDKYNSIVKVINLSPNIGYGGGVRAGIENAEGEWIAYIPGDRQVDPKEVNNLWQFIKNEKIAPTDQVIVKGKRTLRLDSKSMKFVSSIYSLICRAILFIPLKDVNALPKFIPFPLIDKFPRSTRRTFVFDIEIMYLAHQNNYKFIELPVSFLARRIGVSSWSNKRIRVYINTFIDIIKLRLFGSDH
jgi:dolichol-phosphate mannosyltransferase